MDKIKLTCDLCNGSLEMQPGGEKAICEYCGTVYLLERLQEKIKEINIKGNVKVVDADFTIRGGVLERYNGESTEVIIPDNVKSIGKEAFKDCKKITKVIIPDSVDTIEDDAFNNCISLSEFLMSDNIHFVGNSAFANCKSLSSVKLSKTLKLISTFTFSGCIKLHSIQIPDSIKSIGDYAFYGCISLSSIQLSTPVIGNRAFSKCTNLELIQFSASVKSIGEHAFNGCTSLKSITLPNTLEELRIGIFDYCSNLISIEGIKDITTRWHQIYKGGYRHDSDTPLRLRFYIDLCQNTPIYWKVNTKCQHCGGKFKGIFNKICSKCGKPKDY